MLTFAPELVAAVRQKYLYSDDTLEQIAAHFKINARDISRMRELEGWPSRYARVRRVPQLAQMLDEADALKAAGSAESAPGDPRSSGSLASAEKAPAASALPSLTDRMESLIAQEIAAEERARAELGRRPRRRADAARCASRLATLTQTLGALKRLRDGAAPDRETEHDDMPEDIDDFRTELARRIHAFVDSRTGGDVHGRVPGADDAARE
jgi:hypothetical protein